MKANRIATTCGALIGSLAGAAGMWATCATTAHATDFLQTNLVSDGAVSAVIIDPNLVNPWGIAESPTSPFWISDNGTGVATIYQVPGPGSTPVAKAGLTVTIPSGAGTGASAPTGQVFNGVSGGFKLSDGTAATFLFDSEDGAITGWNSGLGTTAAIAVNNSASGAVYKGLAIDNAGGTLFAANFNSGQVEMYNSSFGLLKTFTDSTLPAGYAPFDVKVINNQLYVTFALQDAAKHDDVAGPGNGYVDVFDLNGNFVKRLVSNGNLNSPWGLQIAPSSFGQFAGDLLVGNFGNGMIDAYNATTGAFEGVLDGANGQPIAITDLWGLSVGNGAAGGSANTLYFTAGLVNEGDGLFGSLSAVPEPTTWAMMLVGFAGLAYVARRRRLRLKAG
jgi:uncharacterized protein (TIGR03118 family)